MNKKFNNSSNKSINKFKNIMDEYILYTFYE